MPGTFTNLNDFYRAEVQEIGQFMFDNVPGTVAFVYKDGPFPGEDSEKGGVNFIRITEANDPDTARGSGEQLARFELGMRTDPQFAGAEHDAFGHSWGLANVTSAEVAGVDYDKVISLSGAGMLPEWEADPDTLYVDLSYQDALQEAQSMDLVWGGNNPREHPAFDHDDYYRGPDDDVLDQVSVGMVGEYPSIYVPPDYGSVLVENHNLIASNSDDNKRALRDMLEMVNQ